jgi:hypothetical protein
MPPVEYSQRQMFRHKSKPHILVRIILEQDGQVYYFDERKNERNQRDTRSFYQTFARIT